MKTTSKILLAAIALFIINSSSVFAKSHGGGGDGRFSLGAEVGFPMGTFGDQSSTGFGSTIRYEQPVGDNLALMGTLGFMAFSGKSETFYGVSVTGPSESVIPIQVGAKYYFMEQQSGFYVQAELGVHMFLIPAVTDNGFTVASSTKTEFSYAPGVGYHLDNWDFSARYQLFSESVSSVDASGNAVTTTSTGAYLGIRLAYVFGGK